MLSQDIKPFQRIFEQGGYCVLNIQDMQARQVDERTWKLLEEVESRPNPELKRPCRGETARAGPVE